MLKSQRIEWGYEFMLLLLFRGWRVATSREIVRDALVTLLTTALVGAGLPVKTVTGSKVKNLEGLTPLVSVLSDGTVRERKTFQGTFPTFYLVLQVWVTQEATGWTNAQAEDALDRIESIIADVFIDNVETDNWTLLSITDRSRILEVTSGGRLYFVESFPVQVQTIKQ